VLVGSDCKHLIDLGGFLGKGQDTKDRTKITRKSGGLIAKQTYLLPFDRADRANQGGSGGPGGRWRRCSGELGARVAAAGDRGDEGDLKFVLTLEGNRRQAAGDGQSWRPARSEGAAALRC
jgi:hypothetical protein